MQTSSVAEKSPAKQVEIQKQAISDSLLGIEIGLLTGARTGLMHSGWRWRLFRKA